LAMKIHFSPGDSCSINMRGLCFVCSGSQIIVSVEKNVFSIPVLEDLQKVGTIPDEVLYVGTIDDVPCYGIETLPDAEIPIGMEKKEIRHLFEFLDSKTFEMALTASHMAHWNSSYRYCGNCKGNLIPQNGMRAKKCDQCGRLEFPRLSPAIIVLVEREGKALLGRSPRFAGEFYSVLAGFVEPGESLEDAVHREIMEEVGIRIKNVTYFGSQPWPFPDSLMIGFIAQYESGEITVDGEEIIDAEWFLPNNLPKIPGKISIARKLIDWFTETYSTEYIE
jgi:NAD+ diphosphatase